MFSHHAKAVRIIIALALVLIPIIPCAVSAATITVTNQPSFTSGILTFTVTYISDTQMDLAWTIDGTVANVMVRAKYGAYPTDIPDAFTAPTDGYLVYYGTNLSVSDTSMSFDQNAGSLYYKAWAQKVDGTWYVNTYNSSKESGVVSMILLFGLGLAISAFAIMKKEPVIGMVASAVWVLCLVYTRSNPIGAMVVGDSADNILVTILIGLIAIVPIISWRLGRSDRAREVKEDDYKERVAPRKQQRTTGTLESSSDYYDRLHGITHPKNRGN